MATFTRESAVIEEVYIRRLLPGGKEVYIRQPYNLVTYDDQTGDLIEPISTPGLSDMTARDAESADVIKTQRILDRPPYNEVFEMH